MTASPEPSIGQSTTDAPGVATSPSVATTGSAGSKWRRWDPHIHAPGTKRNNQFADTHEGWDDYLSRLEAATPVIEVIGLTDYLSLDTYEKILTFKVAGRLPQVNTIFPNVEFRFTTGSGKAALNGHLFISPDDPDHVNRARRFLRNLKFTAEGNSYQATPEDLIDLGRLHLKEKGALSDQEALREGINQFKVDLEQLLEARRNDQWARDNILLAVATGQNDGTSGLRDDSLTQFRRNIERNMDIMLSGRPQDRAFWLGEHPDFDVERIEQLYERLKPCLHGCDAHDLDKVARPDRDRYCWIKGGATFEALRQAVIEPERAIVAAAPPPPSQSAHLIRAVTIEGSDWAATPHVELNPGLVCIVGEKGSGKTALADVIAAGAHALDGRISNQSFLRRAHSLLSNATVRLEWADGEATQIALSEAESTAAEPRIQYLSQQFVESMCSAEGMTDELVVELERVLFDAHSPGERMGAADFGELRELRCRRGNQHRSEAEERLASAAADLTAARQQVEIIPALAAEREALASVLATDSAARDTLITQGQQGDSERLRQVTEVIITVRGKLDEARRKTAALIALQDAVKQLRDSRLPRLSSQLRSEHTLAGLSVEEWQRFGLSFSGDVDEVIDRLLAAARDAEFALSGPGTPPEYEIAGNPAIRDGDLAAFTFNDLASEQRRLESQIGLARIFQ